jgi:hypothetical protein
MVKDWYADENSIFVKGFPITGDEERRWYGIEVQYNHFTKHATVHWPSFGAVNKEEAKEYAEGMADMADLAQRIEDEVNKYEITICNKETNEVRTITKLSIYEGDYAFDFNSKLEYKRFVNSTGLDKLPDIWTITKVLLVEEDK